jgi:hypothetical protein
MADNTTTYNAVIDVEVQGQGDVDKLGDSVEKNDAKFVSLRRQIRETTVALQAMADQGKAGTKEFKQLSDKLDDLQDQQKRVAFQSAQIEDKLAALPGPIGAIGKQFQVAKESIDTFGKGLAVGLGIIGLIVSAILAMKEALSRTEEGQKTLNKISEAFEKILNGLFAILEPIANVFADLITKMLSSKETMMVLGKVAGGLSATFTILFGVIKSLGQFIIGNFVNAFKTLVDVAGGAGKVLKGVFTFDYDLIKEGVNQVAESTKKGFTTFVDNAKQAGKGVATAVVDGITTGFDSGEKAFIDGQKRLTKKQKEDAKKNAEESKKAAEEASKAETEAYLATLSERDAEVYKRGQKFNDDKAKLVKAGITDFTTLEEGYRKDLEKINKKYDDAEKKAAEEKQKKLKDDAQKSIDDRVAALDLQSAVLLQKTKEDYDGRIKIVNEKEKELLSNAYLTEAERTKIKLDAEDQRRAINKEALDNQILTIDNEQKQLLAKSKEDYDARIALVDEKEKLLLSDVSLTEAQRTQIQINAAEERAGIRAEQLGEELQANENQLNEIGISYDKKLQLTNEKEALLLQNASLTEAQRTAIIQQASQERINIMLAEKQARADIQNAELDLVQNFGGLLKELAGKNKKLAIAGVVVEQAAAIGKILVNTGIANAKALAASPLTFGQPWVAINTISAGLSIAASVAAGAKAIQQINSSDNGAPASAGSAPSGGTGGAAPAPSAPTLDKAPIPQIEGTGGGSNPTTQLAQTLSAASNKPIKAYVVSGDVTSQQALDRRTTRAATFNG